MERGKPHERSQIISKLSGHIVQLSQHKFASNVVEKCLEYGGPAERELLIGEIFGPNEGSDNLLVSLVKAWVYVVHISHLNPLPVQGKKKKTGNGVILLRL